MDLDAPLGVDLRPAFIGGGEVFKELESVGFRLGRVADDVVDLHVIRRDLRCRQAGR
jgi:hypothetical protein